MAIDAVLYFVAKLKLTSFLVLSYVSDLSPDTTKYALSPVWDINMADPAIPAFQAGSEILAGAPIPFRFEVTWRSLTRPLRPTPLDLSTLTPRHSDAESAASSLSRRAPASEAEPREWEMVLPRMRRPMALAPATPRDPERRLAAPQFTTEPEADRPWWLTPVAGITLLLMLGIVAYRWTRQDSSASQDSKVVSGMEMAGAGWITEWASDAAGSARGRQISLYRPSVGMSDYNLEFLGRIERRSLGWVFRAADSRNYYVAKLEAGRPGAPGLTVTRFAVVGGFEGLHIQRTLSRIPGATGVLKVRLEARGPRFTVYVQNQVVEDWEDDRLKTGGLGFLTEREESGEIGSIHISFPKVGKR